MKHSPHALVAMSLSLCIWAGGGCGADKRGTGEPDDGTGGMSATGGASGQGGGRGGSGGDNGGKGGTSAGGSGGSPSDVGMGGGGGVGPTDGATTDGPPAMGGKDAAPAGADVGVVVLAEAKPLDPGVPAPPAPMALPGLVIWLDAAKGVSGVGDKVTLWEDQSGKKNNAYMDIVKYLPAYSKLSNGLPSIHFSGKAEPLLKNTDGSGGPFLRINDNDTVNFGTGDFLIAVVAAYSNALDGTHNGGFGTFFGKYGPNKEILFSGNWTLTEKTEQSALHIGFGEGGVGFESKRKGFNDNKVRLYVARRSGGTLELRINGAADSSASNAGTDVSTPGINVALGSFSGKTRSDRCLLGDLQLVAVVKGATSATDLKALEDNLKTRFMTAP